MKMRLSLLCCGVLFFILAVPVYADALSGSFWCMWGKANFCVVDGTKNNCKAGHSPTQVYCEQFPDKAKCEAHASPECAPLQGEIKCPLGYQGIQQDGHLPGNNWYICCSKDFIDSLISSGIKKDDWNTIGDRCKANTSVLTNPICVDGPLYEWVPGTRYCRLQGPTLRLCDKLPSNQINTCYDCIGRPGEIKDKNQMWTALGCINTTPTGFISWLLSSAIGLGGGIAFLLMIFGAFQVIISGGDPEKLNSGKEIITSAVAGLLMIIFSVVILKIIGYDILRIPGITLR